VQSLYRPTPLGQRCWHLRLACDTALYKLYFIIKGHRIQNKTVDWRKWSGFAMLTHCKATIQSMDSDEYLYHWLNSGVMLLNNRTPGCKKY
jgi:hypothetical protein